MERNTFCIAVEIGFLVTVNYVLLVAYLGATG